MNITIEVPNEVEFPLAPRDPQYGSLAVDFARFTPDIAQRVFMYGLYQKVRDAASDKKDKTVDEVRALSLKCIDQLYAGEWRVRAEGGEPTDPVEARAYADCKRDLATFYGKTVEAGRVPKGTRGDDKLLWIANERATARHKPTYESLGDVINEVLDAKPDYRKAAAKYIADQANRVADLDI
jgi:hypothetical protein